MEAALAAEAMPPAEEIPRDYGQDEEGEDHYGHQDFEKISHSSSGSAAGDEDDDVF